MQYQLKKTAKRLYVTANIVALSVLFVNAATAERTHWHPNSKSRMTHDQQCLADALFNYCDNEADVSTKHDCLIDVAKGKLPESCFDTKTGVFQSTDMCLQILTGEEF